MEAAEFRPEEFVSGIGGSTRYSLALGSADIAKMIERDFVREIAALTTLARIGKGYAPPLALYAAKRVRFVD